MKNNTWLYAQLDVVSQGYTIDEAIKNLKEAVELYVEEMGLPESISKEAIIVTSFGVSYEKVASTVRKESH
ncbi:MAG: hypothetical protein QMD14_06025 [Candidatus Aenigmarchaeota archaeon]|nr:hypothetical protein [Candidatus Aenigmarchaeota archaeon]